MNMKTAKETHEWFLESIESLRGAIKEDDTRAKELYAALTNMRWFRVEDPSKETCVSWRMAGHLVAALRFKGEDYLDYYCSGNEGTVAPWISNAMEKLGWKHECL